MNFNSQKWWKKETGNGSKAPNSKKIRGIVILTAVIILAVFTVSTMWYTVNDKQEAVVTTFGKVTGVTGPGMHLKLPFGIQRATKVDTNIYQKIELGYKTLPDGTTESIEDESKMISGDYNIVNVDFFVEYKISDAVKYLYQSENPDAILKSLAQSQIRNVIGSYDVDKILTTGKTEIQTQIKEAMAQELSNYDIGLSLTEIRLQDSEPPTAEVIEAFKEVETAKQDKETAVNVAMAYEKSEIPNAEARADKTIQNAEYLKQSRINEANKQVSMFNAMYGEYILNPEVTIKRMYFETIEKVLPNVKVYIDTSENGTQKLLPIDAFTK